MKTGIVLGSFLVSCMEGDAPALSRVSPSAGGATRTSEASSAQLRTGSGFVRITERPAATARTIGYLPPRTVVTHDLRPQPGYGCDGAWLSIQPRGFICADGRTVRAGKDDEAGDPSPVDHSANLPYRYSRTTRSTAMYEGAGGDMALVNRTGTLPPNSSMAIVGAVGAHDERQGRRLALMADGRFVDATALEPTHPSAFEGIELEGRALPLAFVAADGAPSYRIDSVHDPELVEQLVEYRLLSLSGRRLRLDDELYYHVRDGDWVPAKRLRILSRMESLPPRVEADTHWLDIDTEQGSLVMYEGETPVFATLVSVGEGATRTAPAQHHTYPGWHRVVFKHVTGVGLEPSNFASGARIYDLPWAMQLSSGQYIHGSYWHDRFGDPNGPGNVQLSPADARRVFFWCTPERPDNWHSVAEAAEDNATYVNVH